METNPQVAQKWAPKVYPDWPVFDDEAYRVAMIVRPRPGREAAVFWWGLYQAAVSKPLITPN